MIYQSNLTKNIFLFAVGLFASFLISDTTMTQELSLKGASIPYQITVNHYEGISSDYERSIPFSGFPSTKIIGGQPVTWQNRQWQVGLLVSWIADPNEAFFCGGSLTQNKWVITAAHCVYGLQPENINVLSGTDKLDSGGKRGNVEAIYINKSYKPATRTTPPINDIAILKLRDNANGTPIKPITIKQEPTIVIPGENCAISGWGVTEDGNTSNQLRIINVPLQSMEKCNSPESYDGIVMESMICAGLDQGGQDSCQGDSGGPNTKDGFLIGIVSWGEGCAQKDKYGVYTRVALFTDWINKCIQNPSTCEAL